MNTEKKATEARDGASLRAAICYEVMTLTDPVHGGPIRVVSESDYDYVIHLMQKLHKAADQCYLAAYDYAPPVRERDVNTIINEAEEFLYQNTEL